MDDPLHLISDEPQKTAIYTQGTGEMIPYQDLSPVSRKRLDAMLQIYLDYLIRSVGEIERAVPAFGSIHADTIENVVSENKTV